MVVASSYLGFPLKTVSYTIQWFMTLYLHTTCGCCESFSPNPPSQKGMFHNIYNNRLRYSIFMQTHSPLVVVF